MSHNKQRNQTMAFPGSAEGVSAARMCSMCEIVTTCGRAMGIGSYFIDVAAMGNDMNRDHECGRIGCVQDTPVSNTKLVPSRKLSGQRFWLGVVNMLTEPLDFCHDSFADTGIEVGQVFKRVRRELDTIRQRRLSLRWTSSKEIRSVDFKEAARRASMSGRNSSPVSGSASRPCSSSWSVFLISVRSSSTVRSATFMDVLSFKKNSGHSERKSRSERKRVPRRKRCQEPLMSLGW